MKELSLKEKIAQMFILGFSGAELDNSNLNIQNLIKSNLGGVIFFANNLLSSVQFKKLIRDMQSLTEIPLFMSIDQEGGLVERTINFNPKIEYLTQMALCETGNIDLVRLHTEIMAQELCSYGINMNFSPVLDVNTNKNNPIIGIRSFSSNPDEVIKYSEPVYKTFNKNNIIAVGKHFPGHGETGIDSHIDMPMVNLRLEELENIHIKPFKQAIDDGLDALMIAHVNYPAFNKGSKIPASLSKEVITDYLKNKLGFRGLIISDDMVMGGITEHYDGLGACIKAINAGVDILIFRDSSNEIIELIGKLAKSVEEGLISKERIDESVNKIFQYKRKYGILDNLYSDFEIDYQNSQKIIDEIAEKSVKIVKKGSLIPLDANKGILILSPDLSVLSNYKYNRPKLSELVSIGHEISYSLNPDKEEIKRLENDISSADIVVFVSYNAVSNPGQIKLFNQINKPTIAIASGNPYDAEKFPEADSIFLSYGCKTPSLKALARILISG